MPKKLQSPQPVMVSMQNWAMASIFSLSSSSLRKVHTSAIVRRMVLILCSSGVWARVSDFSGLRRAWSGRGLDDANSLSPVACSPWPVDAGFRGSRAPKSGSRGAPFRCEFGSRDPEGRPPAWAFCASAQIRDWRCRLPRPYHFGKGALAQSVPSGPSGCRSCVGIPESPL